MRFIDSVKVGDYVKWCEYGADYWAKVAQVFPTCVVMETGERFSSTGKLYGHDVYVSVATTEDIEVRKVKSKRNRFKMYCNHLTDEEFLKVYEFAVNLRFNRYAL